MNILISSAGRRVSLVRAFQKELKLIYPKGKVFTSDANPELSGACQISDGYFKVPLVTDKNYFDVLIEECTKRSISLIIPTIDAELLPLSENQNRLQKQNIAAVISKPELVAKCRNKRLIHDFFLSKNINIAKEFDKSNFNLPLFIKPIDGSRSQDTYLIKNKEDLTDYHFNNDKLMFLEYLNHQEHDEFTCDLYYSRKHQLKCVVPRKRLEVRDGEVYKALTVRNELISYIKDRLKYVEGAVGCLTSQFFLNKKTREVYGIEINPRFGGGYPLSYLSGANFPKWILQEFYENTLIEEHFDKWESDLLMIRYDDEILVHGYKD